MALVLSRHVSWLRLGADAHLGGHAFRGPRSVVDDEQRAHLESFREPLEVESFLARQPADARPHLAARLELWRRQGLLIEASLDEDRELQGEFGADAEAVKAGIRRTQMRARHDPRVRFRLGATAIAPAPEDAWKVVYLGLCLVLPSVDALVELGAARGCAIEALGSFPADLALIDEQRPDFIVIGDLPRVGLGHRDDRPAPYVDAAHALVLEIRRRSDAPILVRNLPGPTCSLGGLADRGATSHVNKVRTINLALARLAERLPEVHVVDIDQALAVAGKDGLVDDMVVLSHHLASLTWLAERAARDPIASSAYDAAELLRTAAAPRERLEAEYLLAGEDLRVMLALRGARRPAPARPAAVPRATADPVSAPDDQQAFVASLGLRCTIRRETDDLHLARVLELVHGTTQLNTTGETPTLAELAAATLYTLSAADRFADYGLVGACITDGARVRQLVLSCRVLGLGLEQVLLRAAGTDAARRAKASVVEGRLIVTARNQPARHLFASCGFAPATDDPTRWSIDAAALDASPPPPYAVTRVAFEQGTVAT